MSRDQIYNEMNQAFGLVPTFFTSVPEDRIGAEWELFKLSQGQENHIPMKYRELIGLGIAATTKCKYCVHYHSQVARALGATEEEIEEAVSFAKANAGWSTYINGMATDFETFKKEIDQACDHMRAQMAAQGNGQPVGA